MVFLCIPAHCGVSRNKTTDENAKLASGIWQILALPNILYFNVKNSTPSVLKWMNSWKHDVKGIIRYRANQQAQRSTEECHMQQLPLERMRIGRIVTQQ